MTFTCKCCAREDDRTRMGAVACMSCFALPLADQQVLAERLANESQAVENYERAA